MTNTKIKKNALLFFIAFFILFFISSPAGSTPYNYFTRLAEAFINGRLFVLDNPSWLNELIPRVGGGYYIAYPPLPAIISMPIVLFFGESIGQQNITHIIGALYVSATYIMILSCTKRQFESLLGAFMIGAGSIVWFLSSVGSSWYLGQITAALFLTLAITSAIKNKRPLLTGIFLGLAYLARVHVILAIPFFLIVSKKNWRIRDVIMFGLGIVPFVLLNSAYNFARFQVPWDIGYSLIPGVLQESYFERGLVHPSYIGRHLKTAFLALPQIEHKWPFLIPRWTGLSILLTTPAFLLAMLADYKKIINKAALLGMFFVLIPIVMHGTTGFAQFGYRFAVDVYPFLILLTISGSQRISKRFFVLLIIIGVLVNLWGVVLINKLGIVRA